VPPTPPASRMVKRGRPHSSIGSSNMMISGTSAASSRDTRASIAAATDSTQSARTSSIESDQGSEGVASADRIGMFQSDEDANEASGIASTPAGKKGRRTGGTVSAAQFLPSSDAAMHASKLSNARSRPRGLSSEEEYPTELSIRSAATPSQISSVGGGISRGTNNSATYSSIDNSIAGEMVDMSQLSRLTGLGNQSMLTDRSSSMLDQSHLNITTNATMLSVCDAGTPSQMSLAPVVSSPASCPFGSRLRDASTSHSSPTPRPSPEKSPHSAMSAMSPAPLLVSSTPSPAEPRNVPTPPTFGIVDTGDLVNASSRMMNAPVESFLATPPYANVVIGLSGQADDASRKEDNADVAFSTIDSESAARDERDNDQLGVSSLSGLTNSNFTASSAGGSIADNASTSVFSHGDASNGVLSSNEASTSFGSRSVGVKSNATTVVRSNKGKRSKIKKKWRSSGANDYISNSTAGSFPTAYTHSSEWNGDKYDDGRQDKPLPGERIPPRGSNLKRERRRKALWKYGVCVGLVLGTLAIVLGSLALTGNLGGDGKSIDGATSTEDGVMVEEDGIGGGKSSKGEDEVEEDDEGQGEGGDEGTGEEQPAATTSTTSMTTAASTNSNATTTTSTVNDTNGGGNKEPSTTSTTTTTDARDERTDNPTNGPTLSPTYPLAVYDSVMLDALSRYVTDPSALKTGGTPQAMALTWISDDPIARSLKLGGQEGDGGDDENMEAVERLVQRYAAAVMGFALAVPPGGGSRDGNNDDGAGDNRTRRLGGVTRGLLGDKLQTASATGSALKTGWYSVSDECTWQGVKCRKHPKGYAFESAFELNLARMSQQQNEGDIRAGSRDGNASRFIPPEIGLFTRLERLDLAENGLVGRIPDELYQLVHLEGLFLEYNELIGPLGAGIGKLTALADLYLGNNKLEGEVPKELTNLRVLRTLILHQNNFSGRFPRLRLRDLFHLDLSYNRFSGPLPDDLEKYVTLRMVYLDHNQFQGTIPSTYVNIGRGRLMQLTLDNNRLCGGVPSGWMHGWDYNKFLLAVTFHNNYLNETLPDDLCKLSVLGGTGDLVELSSDCLVCGCTNRWNLCGRGQCRAGYEGVDAATREAECEAFQAQQMQEEEVGDRLV